MHSPRNLAAAFIFLADEVCADAPAGNGYQSPKWRLPKWTPTYNMQLSSIIMPCNKSGWHNVTEATGYGIVDYDWSNAKQLWANAKPMDCQERLVSQAEMVLAAGTGTQIWVYRNPIKALPWFTDVREKLDDPQYAGWFVKFKNYPQANGSYHVPACTWETSQKCSEFYHDQGQTPHHPQGDGSCLDECDCGNNPCGEYVFDYRNSSLREWIVNDYIISESTILHDGITGLYLDDRLETWGVSEEDGHFVEDTGLSSTDMEDMVTSYRATMEKLYDAIVDKGGFAWQMFDRGPALTYASSTPSPDECATTLRNWCKPNSTAYQHALVYSQRDGDGIQGPHCHDEGSADLAEQATAEFLLTRGPYAWIGYGWCECQSHGSYPRPAQWDADYGNPTAVCTETGSDTKVFKREWSKASVQWDCHAAKGSITMKQQDQPLQLV